MSARLAPSSRPLPSLFVAFLSFFVFPWPSPPRVINVIIIIIIIMFPEHMDLWEEEEEEEFITKR